MIDGKNFFNQPVKNDKVMYENIRKIATGDKYQGDEYTTKQMTIESAVCQTMSTLIKKYCKMIAIDLSKQQALDADPKAIQQINFTENLNRAERTRFYFILERQKKQGIFEFSQGTVKVL